MATTDAVPIPTDLATCDREPIHVPGSIQPHGVLLVLDESELTITQTSVNTRRHLWVACDRLLGSRFDELFEPAEAESLTADLRRANLDAGPLYLRTATARATKTSLHVIAHRFDNRLIVELEPAPHGPNGASFHNLYPIVSTLVGRLKRAETVEAISEFASVDVKRLTGFDRVLVYRFDESWNGQVIGEATDESYSPYLHLWFPASDIPKQARKLYELNRLRLIADVNYQPVPIVSTKSAEETGPLDLSFASLRSVSPIHIEYLKNMEVRSSLSISLLAADGRLWGLIVCHSRSPQFVPLEVRTACDLLAQMVSTQLEVAEERAAYERRIGLTSVMARLLSYMAQEDDFLDGLGKHSDELLAVGDASGAAIVHAGACTCLGSCPPEPEILLMAEWLKGARSEEVFHTDSLPALLPHMERFQRKVSGLLAISISKIYDSYVMWFRPEVIQTVKWGGDPRKPVEGVEGRTERLHPRQSFETWKEMVRGRSRPWQAAEIEVAGELRHAIIGIVLKKAEELAELSVELQKSNQELEAFNYSVSHDLQAPFRHILGYSELLHVSAAEKLDEDDRRYINVIMQAANFAGTLVENLLSFSHLGRTRLVSRRIDTNRLIQEVRIGLEREAEERAVVWKVGNLPEILADEVLIRLVWQNLLQNAVKFSRYRETAVIEVEGAEEGDEIVFSVRDNGAGFDQASVEKLFGVFQRLHRAEDFEGSGIGLANVKRIVTRHGGRVWARGELDVGASFFFTLPKRAW